MPGVECGWSPTNVHVPGWGRDRGECIHCDAPVGPVADGPGEYEVVVEARVRVVAGSRRFAELRATDRVEGLLSADRVAVVRVTKHDGPEFDG